MYGKVLELMVNHQPEKQAREAHQQPERKQCLPAHSAEGDLAKIRQDQVGFARLRDTRGQEDGEEADRYKKSRGDPTQLTNGPSRALRFRHKFEAPKNLTDRSANCRKRWSS
jgi:hypothetical protein